MIWVIIVVAIVGFFWWINATASARDAQKALDIIGDSHSLIQTHFPYSNYRSAWTDIICVESAYLALIVFVHGITIDGVGSNQKQEMVGIIIDRWCGFILRVSTLPNTPNNINIVKQKIKNKQKVYLPLIDKYFQNMISNNRLRNNPDIIAYENYELYENFMEFALENYQDIMSNPHSCLTFHRNKVDNNHFFAIHDSIFNEQRSAGQNKHDYYHDLRREGKGSDKDLKIDERTKFIRHHITLLLSCCNEFKQQRHIS
ncbi:hypothetical protein [Moraxella bovis]|uniref:hypothetical protein n=1 Tax=Moraxella bovis TaxID=476 RepID=UPI000DC7E483|nr:hypothetical protein [Moraxella bovis]AWY19744.1 hypothetical protein DQF64_04010 [Moraxella bovis]